MKKAIFLFVLLSGFLFTSAQDIGVTQITSPVSGCTLTSTENVVVKIFNYGTNMSGVPFDVSYTLDGGAAVTDIGVVFASFLTNSTVTYTITVPANLSAAGTHTISAATTLTGDINPSNDSITGYTVTNTALPTGGTVSGGGHVCKSSNSGTLTLSGQVGTIDHWEQSTDGVTWPNIGNTTTSQSYTNISVKTYYRVQITNSCGAVYSLIDSLIIDPASVGGNISANATRCITDAATYTLTLSGQTGSIVKWQSSTGGGPFVDVVPANTTNTQTYVPSVLGATTKFRAVVQSGVCSSTNSGTVTVTIAPLSVGGTISPQFDTVCSGSNSGTLTLSGKTGTVTWQVSTNGINFSNVTPANTTTSLTFNNLTSTRYYRVKVQSSPCSVAYSDTAQVTVIPASVGGSVSTSTAVCGGSSGTLNLAGQTGNVVDWEQSTDGGSTWSSLGNTTTSQTYTNIAATTLYHAIVQSGSCALATSTAATITVTGSSIGGTLSSASSTVCSGANNGTVDLNGEAGSITGWISSTDNGATWTPIANTTSSEAFTNILSTTMYVAIVKNSTCPSDTSDTLTINVDPATVGGYVDTSTSVCFGNNGDTLILRNYVGTVLNWEFSTDNGSTWLSIVNSTDSLVYSNLLSTTLYHVLVQSGVCNAAYSSPASIIINPAAVGGTAFGNATVCQSGNSGTITLVGNVGSVVDWESSIDNGTSWGAIANTTTTLNYTNLTQTTWFRTIVASGGCGNDTSTVAIIQVDSISIGGSVTADDTVCAGQNADTLVLSGYTGAVVSWEISTDGGSIWIPLGNNTATQAYHNLTATTQFRVEVKNGVCSQASATAATITVDQTSNAGTIASSATVCETYNGGTLVLSGVNGNVTDWEMSSDNGLTWSSLANISNSQIYSGLTDTTWFHTIAVNGVCGADTSTPAVITVIPKPNASFTKHDTCFGKPTVFTNTTTVQGGYVQLFTWDFGDNGNSTIGSPAHTYADTGTYNVSLVALSNFGCKDTFTLPVIVKPLPVAVFAASGPTTFCSKDSITISVPNGANSVYSWNTGSANDSITVNTSGTWSVTITDSITGCTNSNSISTVVNPSPVVAFTKHDTCFGNPTVFTNTSSIGAGGSIILYTWDFSDNSSSAAGSPVHTYASPGTYNVSLSALSNQGCIDTFQLSVIVKSTPSVAFTFSGPTTFCLGDTVAISIPDSTNNIYLWNTGDTLSSITVDTTGTWSITVTDTITGCSNSDSTSTILLPSALADAGKADTISLGNSITLNGSGGGYYNWSPAASLDVPTIFNPVASPTTTTMYYLTVTSSNGCSSTDSVQITVEMQYDFEVSTVITPNGDGYNDFWYIKNITFYPENEVTIFNRYGQKVFGMTGYDNSWTGTYNNAALPDGTYYYVLKFTNVDKSFNGAITVLRSK